jgi:ABC-type multidrug transport system fused ATPase/permease subunit
LVLDLIVTAIAFIVVTIAVRTIGKIDPGLIGIALVNIVNFSVSIKGLIANWTTLETSIGAVSRVRSFKIDTESEHRDCERDVPPPEWPFAGHIEFRNVTASWKASADPVIKNFSLAIAPGQKLAICGQSGSGKSSIISTLFRLLDPSQGSILIDGLDISALNRQSVRSRLICVTQTPYLLPGALVRANIDPFNNATDQEITAALKEVQLWDAIEKMGGLDVELEPDSFSVGERQLLCLARAMLRHGSILVLDEATASVDVDTDELMQDIIRKHFAHHTVIAIAHRLNTILDFDRVAVVARGELLEYDSPRVLLGKPSAFRDAYDKSSHGRVEHNVVNDADEST